MQVERRRDTVSSHEILHKWDSRDKLVRTLSIVMLLLVVLGNIVLLVQVQQQQETNKTTITELKHAVSDLRQANSQYPPCVVPPDPSADDATGVQTIPSSQAAVAPASTTEVLQPQQQPNQGKEQEQIQETSSSPQTAPNPQKEPTPGILTRILNVLF